MPIGIRDIAAADSYTGTAALGGSLDGEIKIDVTPLNQLAIYSMWENKARQEQAEKDAQAKLKELASVTAIDWQNVIPAEKSQLVKIATDFKEYVKGIAAKDLKDPNVYLEYQSKKNEAQRAVDKAKERYLSFGARMEKIANETNIAEKARLQALLDRDVANSKIDEPLPLVQQYDIKAVEIPIPPVIDIKVAKVGANNNTEISNENIVDPAAVEGLAFGIVNRLNDRSLKSTKDEMTALEANGTLEPINSAKIYTEAIKSYINPQTGELDTNRFFSSGSPVAGVAQQAMLINEERAKMRQRIANGEFGNQLDATKFKDINWQDGISPEELVQIRILAKKPKQIHKEDITHTGQAAKYSDLANDRERIRLAWANFGLDKKKLENADTGDMVAADGILREVADIINKGDNKSNQVTVVDKQGNKKTVFTIGEPTVLQKFGNIDKDGTVTNVPDQARYNPKTNEIDLVYFKKDSDGKPEANNSGGYWIAEQKTLNSRTWANMVAQRTYSGQDRGKVNELVQSIITKNGGDLYKIAKALNGQTTNASAQSFEIINPKTGQVVMTVNSQEEAGKAKAKGYQVKNK